MSVSVPSRILRQCVLCGHSGIPDGELECPECGANLLAQKCLLPIGFALFNGQYQIERTLGQGGFGITYQAYDVNLHRRVAIKEFFPQHYVSRDQRTHSVVVSPNKMDFYQRCLARFEQEGRILAKLSHRGIVSVFCLFRERNTCYLVMELLQGHSLAVEMEARGYAPVSSRLTQRIIHVLTDALTLIHAQGILHLDIKPDNIVLTYDGRVVLLDFGAARWERDRSAGSADVESQVLAYTPEYAPLELIQGHELGPYTDIYELGLLSYELLTGKRPPNALKRLRGECQWDLSDLDPPWQAMVEWATRLYPAERPQSVGEWWDSGFASQVYRPTRPLEEPSSVRVEQMAYRFFRILQRFRLQYRYYLIAIGSASLLILFVGIGWNVFAENSLAIQRGRAEQALRAGRPGEALLRYDQAIRLAPESADLYEARAGVRLQLQNYDGAIADYREAMRLSGEMDNLGSKLAEVWMLRGDSQQSQGEYEAAISSYETAVRLHEPQRPLVVQRIHQARLGQARNFAKANNYQEAIRIYEALLSDNLPSELQQETQQEFVNLLFSYGQTLQEDSKFADAIRIFSLAIRYAPKEARFYAARGSSYLQSDQVLLAKTDLDKAISLDKSVADYFLLRATIQGRLQNYLSGIADYDQALRLGLASADLYVGRGLFYMQIANYRAAVDNFNHAIVKEQANPQAYIYRGWSLYHLKQYNQAILDFNEAIRLTADDPLAYEGSGYVKFYLRDRKGSLSDLNKARELYSRRSKLDNIRKIDEFMADNGL